jgi:putative (di)nucleoside polyphosphate hydrolase
MKYFLSPLRHTIVLKPGERHSTPEEVSAEINDWRRKTVIGLKKHFPLVQVLGIEDADTILVELPDGDPDLRARICAELDCVTGPVPGDEPPEPDWREDILPTFEAVAEAHRLKEYRPTVVAIIRDEQGRILFVQSTFNRAEWMFVQGGIEEGESPIAALTREMREEVGIGPRRTRRRPPRYVGTIDLDAEEGRTDKRGFTKGKRYFIYEVMYRGPERLKLQTSELVGYEWIPPIFNHPRLLKIIAGTRSGKGSMMISAILEIL